MCSMCFFILFDGKGYKVDSIGELVKYFRQATRIDQINFTIETYQSRQSNRMNGSWMELRIDERNSNSSTMIVASEDNEWVDSLWITIQDLLNKCKNKFRFFRTAWTMLSIQISGVTVGFVAYGQPQNWRQNYQSMVHLLYHLFVSLFCFRTYGALLFH